LDGFRRFNPRSFNWPVLVWSAALVIFVCVFFSWYRRDMRPRRGSLEWIGALERPKLSFLKPVGRMARLDVLCALALTLAYGALAFAFTGDTKAPQSFWRAGDTANVFLLDLGEVKHLDTFMYYTGLMDGSWTLELSEDGENWRTQSYQETDQSTGGEITKSGMTQAWSELFKWRYARLEADHTLPTRYIRASASRAEMELGELILVEQDDEGRRVTVKTEDLRQRQPEYGALFDEQTLVPRTPTQNNGTIFDEIYHARTAYEYIQNVRPTETTHPPLGKGIISLGIQIFGMTPFGWRFMGILFGVLMVPVFYVLVKNIFGNTAVAICGTAVFAFENMHFTQTHLATIDTYGVFFTLLMYLFMYRYICSGYETPFRKTLLPLALCGLSFGFGAASKWTGIYAALGLVALYVVYLVLRGRHQAAAGQRRAYVVFLAKTLAASLVFFVVLPLVIYTASYIPYVSVGGKTFAFGALLFGWGSAALPIVFLLGFVLPLPVLLFIRRREHPGETAFSPAWAMTFSAGSGLLLLLLFLLASHFTAPAGSAGENQYTLKTLWDTMWNNQKAMLDYHGRSVLGNTHPYESRWWMWLFDIRPILYYDSGYQDGLRTAIGAFTNPLVTVGGLAALGAVLMDFFRRRSLPALFIFVGYMAQLVPWIPVERITFAYHYFPAMIFLALALCYVFNNIWQRRPEHRRRVYLFAGLCVGLFVLLLPPIVGIPMPQWYSQYVVKWLPTWPF
jgi:dolichyl-phosphate-mannose--protein O-mannosyl transferase